MIKRVLRVGVYIISVLFLAATILFAAQPAEQNKVAGEIQGRISGIGKDYIAITYHTDDVSGTEYEALLPIDKTVKLDHVQRLDQLGIGDIVSVEYHDDSKKTKDGVKTFRKGHTIHFISRAAAVTENE